MLLSSVFPRRLTKLSHLKCNVITELIDTKVGISCTSVTRIHRLRKHGSPRLVILFFHGFNEKQDVLRSASNLKATRIFIKNDFSRYTLHKRMLLWNSAKQDRENNSRVSLIFEFTQRFLNDMNLRILEPGFLLT